MVTKEALKENFSTLGAGTNDPEVLDKCVEICEMLGKNEEEFVDMWLAFSIKHYENFEPTLDGLKEFCRSELKHKKEKPEKPAPAVIIPQVETIDFDDEEDNILGLYGCKVTTPKQIKKRRSPEPFSIPETKMTIMECPSPSLVPGVMTTPKHRESGRILASIGQKVSDWKNTNNMKPSITKSEAVQYAHVPSDAMYMFELLPDKMSASLSVCRDFGLDICKAWHAVSKKDISYSTNAYQISQKPFRTWGRIRCSMKKQGNALDVIYLESCEGFNSNKKDFPPDRLPFPELDLSKVQSYSFFPGQIVGIECTNPTGYTLVVQEVYTERGLELTDAPTLSGYLRLNVAAGPFTTVDNLHFQPLWDLMERVAAEEPHVLVLIGPFVDPNHQELKNLKSCTYQELIDRTVVSVMDKVRGKCTQIVLVASGRDIHHDHPVYPTPEHYRSREWKNADLHLMPDPCTLCIDGLNIGITSVDSVMHLGRTEIACKPKITDKLSRLAYYILNQGSFYPLYPPAKEITVDTTMWKKYAFMDELPHLLFLPSDMRYFCKVINGCVVVNTGRLNKVNMCARIDVQPSSEKWSHEQVSCEIFKV